MIAGQDIQLLNLWNSCSAENNFFSADYDFASGMNYFDTSYDTVNEKCKCWLTPSLFSITGFLECLKGNNPCPAPTSTLPSPNTPSPSNTPPPTSAPSCPTDSLFGCYPNTATPILAAWIPNTHIKGNYGFVAADFVPDGAPSGTQLNWEKNPPFDNPLYRTVHAVVGGQVLSLGRGNYRIRTNQTVNRGGTSFSVCYEYLHLEPISGSPLTGTTIPAGQPLGVVEDWKNDTNLPQDSNKGPSHVHVAIFPCNANDPLMNLAGGQKSQLDPLTELHYIKK